MNSNCNFCHGRGIIFESNLAVPCSCMQQKAILNRFKQSRLPKRMQNHTFENFNLSFYSRNCLDPVKKISYYESAQIALQAAKDFSASFKKNKNSDGLLFTGQVGSGKTFLACCIANYLLKENETVLFAVVPDLLDQIRSTYDSSRHIEYTEKDLVDTAREVPLLILDDLGAHNYTDWTKNKLYSILNYRLNYCLPTIITTNISLEELEEYLGERSTSRIFQMCRPYRLLVDMDIRIVLRQK
ncbi:ATP-binding protein [Desulfolucanica intricata]|uniref:ATP-binding protein n=1 Tax=Desulfolucanica intricata TaxID=1285191 RepID=UPI00082B30D0|nr:ATP-binding protein [Desulfolucanica intricata]